MGDELSSIDWVGVEDPWVGINVDLSALQGIVCELLHVRSSQCGPPAAIGTNQQANYARIYSFQLPTQTVVARLVAPVKPLFKTQGEVAAMDFIRSRTSLPVPKNFAYCSEANNPVGAEWIIMEHVVGVEMGDIWSDLQLTQKRRLAQDLVDMYYQLSRLKADCCGSIYHSVDGVDDCNLGARSPRWKPLSAQSLRLLRSHCSHSIANGYTIGPLNEISLLNYRLSVPSPSQTSPTFTSDDYVQLVAYNGKPSMRSDYDLPTRQKCVELFRSIHRLYSQSSVFGPDADRTNFCFSHGDFHEGNILIDPRTGAITGIIDWEAAAFRPLWGEVFGVGWFEEDRQRFIFGSDDPGNFEDDNNPEDEQLRAFFRTELYKRNPDLLATFLGGSELRAVVHAAADQPRPIGETDIFLNRYYGLGYWNEKRRGRFPWDMETWQHKRIDLDEKYGV